MKNQNNEDRYVTTAPSYDAKLRPNDKVGLHRDPCVPDSLINTKFFKSGNLVFGYTTIFTISNTISKVFVLAQSEMELVCPIELGRTDLENSSDDETYEPSPRRTHPSKPPPVEISVPIAVEEVPTPEPTITINNVSEHIELKDTYFGANDMNHKVVDNPLIVETTVPGKDCEEVTEIKSNDAAHLIA